MQALRRLKYIVVFVLSVVIVASGVFWVTQTTWVHSQWASMFREAQRFSAYLSVAAYLLNNTTIQTNETAQRWFSAELSNARDPLYELENSLDEGHWRQLERIGSMIDDVDGFWPIFGLNSSMRSAFEQSMYNIGEGLVSAYETNGDYIRGPSLWYFGPSPPDETLLEKACQLADNVETTILDLQTVHLPSQP